ncbi:CDP-diacylglycerol--glycerol-3-phosphate 3-phosphatidyltransferase [Pectobacteriaceae bacterium CE70]|uniref:CDP-diacylglycerol--glycerol-3-phosphate 3-phosphatidyltransferase n=1 Tax=Serratia sp. (strain ATCC 39006) TaxID=104623 RepID=A0A2I5T9R6_SERS3|nr:MULTISPECIES: CDP-diacylglycerol--glycerol-3-phosphate 3-phosphatidyltransferase [Enterobacterales]WJV64067.1 CDP-diacylglycerol--glycerol-3-phosphate 3-phosphatidyltransferase [Pectobacteriaceae bacterium C52]WJV68479.1 CDP-diacylglycerol--glycerol-3-phosphate 3-phosphatidyltransferase [Pectobacteriaceae bacterium CE70]WJY12409.1 CDP-diacylglycerol--glycerol-3-phosphate 3-phosphatidyltransferase [Pectobacteriaceae bacterium C80]AUH01315.1 CDP-diacylglycerol--glycerol-3-phosphate 3-phosphati
MQFNIPTWLTLFRIALIPFFVLAFYLPFAWAPMVCAIIFVCAAVTDWFDGFLARRWKQTTRFGAFLDPVADKVMVAVALVLVAEHYHSWWITLPAATMIAREIIISALREWMAEIGKRSSVAVSWIGKIKTMAQMIALLGLLWRPERIVEGIGVIALYIAAVLTFWSMFQYLNAARHDLFEH